MRNVITEKTLETMKEYKKLSEEVVNNLLTDIGVGHGEEDSSIDLGKEEVMNYVMQTWRESFMLLKDQGVISDEDYLKLMKSIM